MSQTKGDETKAAAVGEAAKAAPATAPSAQLADLMASPAKDQAPTAAPAKGPDLDAAALSAAEAAIRDGERALAAARASLAPGAGAAPARRGSRGRELALRLLLAANVLAMIVVAALPTPSEKRPAPVVAPGPAAVEPAPPVNSGPRPGDKYVQAIEAAERRDYATAITLLEQYLLESPRMAQGSQLSVLMMLAHYCQLVGRFPEARDYERRVQAVAQSHSLPEDLVAMAKAAAEAGDQDSLRRVWARFLLQQRQVPSSLYQHVAEAYLQLGDSYRQEANAAAEQARLRELAEVEARLREKAAGGRK